MKMSLWFLAIGLFFSPLFVHASDRNTDDLLYVASLFRHENKKKNDSHRWKMVRVLTGFVSQPSPKRVRFSYDFHYQIETVHGIQTMNFVRAAAKWGKDEFLKRLFEDLRFLPVVDYEPISRLYLSSTGARWIESYRNASLQNDKKEGEVTRAKWVKGLILGYFSRKNRVSVLFEGEEKNRMFHLAEESYCYDSFTGENRTQIVVENYLKNSSLFNKQKNNKKRKRSKEKTPAIPLNPWRVIRPI